MNETTREYPQKIVRQISYEATKPFILLKHYAGRMPSISYAFGLYLDNKIVGVCTFGQLASPFLCKGICGEDYADIVLELNRLVIEATGRNLASFLISSSIRLLPKPLILVSYADTGFGHVGYVYQATNWLYTGCTKERTDVNVSGNHSRHYDKATVDYSNRQFRSAKHRYVYFHASKTDRKRLKSLLRYAVLPYPKGDTSRHNVGAGFYKQDDLPFANGGDK